MSAPKIVLLTSGQPSLNPRLVKEADALVDAGYAVTVIYQYWNAWGTIHDQDLLAQKSWKSIRVAGSPDNSKALYYLSRIIQKVAFIGYRYFPVLKTEKWAISRSSYFLLREAKKHQAAIYIGHNLGALPATVIAARYHQAKCGFDAEDFHRQETTDNANAIDYQLKKKIENQYIPKVDYLTTASPLISEKYQSLFPQHKPITILNTFDNSFKPIIAKSKISPLKLLWFSQTIGENRGIEVVIKALAGLESSTQLHLLGNYTSQTVNYFEQLAKQAKLKSNQLFYHYPIPANKIIDFASQFDIGLATELSMPLNRDICLTNKIFTYLTAGLAVIASDTSAQTLLLKEHQGVGSIFKQNNHSDLAEKISNYANNHDLLASTKSNAIKLSKEKLSWKIESQKFLRLIEKTLKP